MKRKAFIFKPITSSNKNTFISNTVGFKNKFYRIYTEYTEALMHFYIN